MDVARADLVDRRGKAQAKVLVDGATNGKAYGERVSALLAFHEWLQEQMSGSTWLRRKPPAATNAVASWAREMVATVGNAVDMLRKLDNTFGNLTAGDVLRMKQLQDPPKAIAAFARGAAFDKGIPKPTPVELMLLAVITGVETPTAKLGEQDRRLGNWVKREKAVADQQVAAFTKT